MPCSARKARVLLKEGKAKPISREPFKIQLLYGSSGYKQPITLGVDSGYKYIGYSAVTKKTELMGGTFNLLKGISERLKERASYRRTRRGRLRYRKPGCFKDTKPSGWLAPSLQHKLDSHVRFIEILKNLMPITKVIIEVANFDIQAIKNPYIKGKGYQEGDQLGFENTREYVLHRDNHKCQNLGCKGKSEILKVHHLGYWKKDRSDRPSNLITLCSHCHTSKNHQSSGFLYGWKSKLKSFREATFMSVIRWKLVNQLQCEHTYGFETKAKRRALSLDKSHHNDAFVIANGAAHQDRCEVINFDQYKRNNRSLEKFYDAKYSDTRDSKTKSGKELSSQRTSRTRENLPENLRLYRGHKIKKGRRSIRTRHYSYQPNDYVVYEDYIYTVKGTHNKGTRVILKETGKSIKVGLLKPYMFRSGICINY
jgi:hypothetical protein